MLKKDIIIIIIHCHGGELKTERKQLMVTFSLLGQEAVPVLTAPLVPVPALDLVGALNLGPRDVLVVLPRFAPAPAPALTHTHTPEAAPLLAVPLLHLPKQMSL